MATNNWHGRARGVEALRIAQGGRQIGGVSSFHTRGKTQRDRPRGGGSHGSVDLAARSSPQPRLQGPEKYVSHRIPYHPVYLARIFIFGQKAHNPAYFCIFNTYFREELLNI